MDAKAAHGNQGTDDFEKRSNLELKKKLDVLPCQLSTKTSPSLTKTNLEGDGQQKTQDHPLLDSRMRKYEGNLLYLTLLYKNGNFRALNFKITLLFINLLQELKLSE